MLNLFWFRRDLRLDDNAALYKALQAGNVIPLFIFDPDILDELPANDQRVNFIYERVITLRKQLLKHGSDLWVFYGKPKQVFETLFRQLKIDTLYAARDYEPPARRRDTIIKKLATQYDVKVCRVKDQVIFEAGEILKNDGNPYTVFTPYSKKWLTHYAQTPPVFYNSEEHLHSLCEKSDFPDNINHTIPSLKDMGFEPIDSGINMQVPDPDIISDYDQIRDFPAKNGSTQIGPHLRFGSLSIRKMAQIGQDLNSVWLRQLIWRDFFSQILFYYPHTETQAFRPQYDTIPWREDKEEFEKWRQGQTGFALVDAGMRELNETGYMHNRVRMLCANFLTKLLLIDWRQGEAYFAKKLLDYDMSNNIGGWQWACGSGCDAAPYFRIFNPDLQIQKFDPDYEYIRKWVNEFDSLKYPKKMVDYKAARERALQTYKNALQSKK